jgi:hypothetical protein
MFVTACPSSKQSPTTNRTQWAVSETELQQTRIQDKLSGKLLILALTTQHLLATACCSAEVLRLELTSQDATVGS